MPRVKGGQSAHKKRKSLLEKVKGYRFGRSKKFRQAHEAWVHAGNHAFAHRKDKKGDFRRLWTVRINAAVRPFGLSYSRFMDVLKKKNIGLNRKVLSEIAAENPDSFERIVKHVQ